MTAQGTGRTGSLLHLYSDLRKCRCILPIIPGVCIGGQSPCRERVCTKSMPGLGYWGKKVPGRTKPHIYRPQPQLGTICNNVKPCTELAETRLQVYLQDAVQTGMYVAHATARWSGKAAESSLHGGKQRQKRKWRKDTWLVSQV